MIIFNNLNDFYLLKLPLGQSLTKATEYIRIYSIPIMIEQYKNGPLVI